MWLADPQRVRGFGYGARTHFFEQECRYGVDDVEPGVGLVALVLDATRHLGAAYGFQQPVVVETEGRQLAVLRVASPDGGFIVPARTQSAGGKTLKPGDVVLWVSRSKKPTFPVDGGEFDHRGLWEGDIVAVIAPEVDLMFKKRRVLGRY